MRGGDGLVREVEFCAPVTVSLLSERRVYAPYGLNGGTAGLRGRNVLIRDGEERLLPGKTTVEMLPGDVLRIETPGGGGFGAPLR